MPDHVTLTRRSFLHGMAAVGAGSMLTGVLAGDAGAAPRQAGRWKLGLDTYTLHRSLTAKDPKRRRNLVSLLESLGEHQLDGLQVDPSHFPGGDPAALGRLRDVAKRNGWYIEFGMGGWDPQRMEERIKLTAQFGGRALRTFFSDERATWKQLQEWMRYAEPAFKQAGDTAAKHNVWIAIENHGDFTGPQLREFIGRVNHPRVGACLDTGNCLFRREDPIACARALAPVAFSMHLKDWTMGFDSAGTPRWKEAPLGAGRIPVAEVLKIVAASQPELYVALETPIVPGDDEAENVQREWEHLRINAKRANQLLRELGLRRPTV